MTRQMESTELDAVVHLLADHGFDGMAQSIETLMNEAMKLQRSEALGALPYSGRRTAAATPTASSPRRSTAGWGNLRCKSRRPAGSSSTPPC